MRILICGSRHFKDANLFWQTMENLSEKYDFDNKQPITIIEGGARGADTFAKDYAEHCGWELEEYPADWEKHGKAAGPIRNRQMVSDGKPDLVVAFLAADSRGTKDMVKVATEAGIPVKVINID